MTPDRLVICLEELIREMASSDSGKIRAGIDVALCWQLDVQIGQYVVSRWSPLCVVVAGCSRDLVRHQITCGVA